MSSTPVTAANSGLLRTLRKWDLVALVLNSVIGAGIFGLPARAYALAGVYSLLSYLICAVVVFLIVLCFAEVGSRFKETGGLYLYAKTTFGPVVGFEVGWLAWLARMTAFAALCNLFADYFSYFVPIAADGPWRAVVLIAVTCGLAATNVAGVRAAASFGNVVTIGKLLPLLLLIGGGLLMIDPSRLSRGPAPSYTEFSASVL